MAGPIERGWCVVRPGRLRIRRFDEEVVVYDDESGDTHLLDDDAGTVLERLLRASEPFHSLAAASSPDRAREVLRRLRRLGIVKPLRK